MHILKIKKAGAVPNHLLWFQTAPATLVTVSKPPGYARKRFIIIYKNPDASGVHRENYSQLGEFFQ